jgi:Fur family iron response transcriptional regulator
MSPDLIIARLKGHGIQPSAQRLAVAEYVLSTDEHPSAERVLARVQASFPMLSRATVYNTLNLFVEKGLLRQHAISEGSVVFDPVLTEHHHFIDEETGLIEDIPWESVRVGDVSRLKGYEIRDYMVVMRGKKLSGPRASGRNAVKARKR